MPHYRFGWSVSLAALVLAPLVAGAQQAEQEIRVSAEPATLVWHNREIITFRAEVQDFSPRDRVRSSLVRIDALDIGAFPPEVVLQRVMGAIAVQAQTQTLFIIVQEDLPPDVTLDHAAAQAKTRLEEALAAYAELHSRDFLMDAGVRTAVSTAVFVVVFLLLFWIGRRILKRLPRPEDPAFEKLKVTGFRLGPYAAVAVRGMVRLTFLALQLSAGYLWVTYVLGIFPYTRPWSESAAGFVLDTFRELGLGALRSIPGLLTVILIFWITRLFVRIANAFFSAVEERTIEVSWLQPETSGATRRLFVAIVWIFSITVAYPYIPGSESAAFKGVSVFVGLMVSLGSAGLVNQVMSGLVVVYSRAFKPGDVIRVNDIEGIVSEIGVLSTKVLTRRIEEVTIPNAVLVNTASTNFSSVSKEKGVILHTAVTIGYDTPWRQVHAMLLLAAARTDGVRQEPSPFVHQKALGDWYVEYDLNFHVDNPARRPELLSALHRNIQDAFNEFGVQIMSPHFIAQPDKAVLSPKEQWYEAPAKKEE